MSKFKETWEKGNYEIYFEAKPSPDIIQALKNNGYRWNHIAKCWTRRKHHSADFLLWLDGIRVP